MIYVAGAAKALVASARVVISVSFTRSSIIVSRNHRVRQNRPASPDSIWRALLFAQCRVFVRPSISSCERSPPTARDVQHADLLLSSVAFVTAT